MAENEPKRYLGKVYEMKDGDETRALYNEWAEVYDAELSENAYQTPRRVAEALRKMIDPNSTVSVLDVGCGSGLSGMALHPEGFTTIDGCDYSTGMLAKAKEAGVYRRLFEADLNAPPMDCTSSTYDAVALVGVFSFGHVMADALDDVLRVAKTEAPIIIGMNNHFYEEGSVPAKLEALAAQGKIVDRQDEIGDHLPGVDLKGWVITFRKV